MTLAGAVTGLVIHGGPATRRRRTRGPGTALTAILALLLVALSTIFAPATTLAAAPSPTPGVVERPGLTMTATPLLDGNVRAGEWAAFRVHAENDGPAIDGELRVAKRTGDGASYALPIELPTGARQDHTLYARTDWSGGRYVIDLVEGGDRIASVPVTLSGIDQSEPIIAIVAERPERINGDLRRAVASQPGLVGGMQPRFPAFTPDDLPSRAEAWGTMDWMVWQDVPASALDADQVEALRTWLTLGGDLVIVGGTLGPSVLDGFPADILPIRADGTVDVPPVDLAPLIGTLPPDATTIGGLGGTLAQGTALAGSGDKVIAARTNVGKGSVTILGVDPTAPWLTGTAAATTLWLRLLPSDDAARMQQLGADDGSFLQQALSVLPSADGPHIDQLFLLFVAYLLLLGPIGYLVLKRLDKREWAWITIPLLALVFTISAYALGVTLKGSDVLIRELGVVRSASGGDRGLADVAVGIISPRRATYDVEVPGGALLSELDNGGDRAREDILLGEHGGLRGLEVGVGTVRGFRVQTVVETPRIDTDLTIAGDRLQGTVTNASDRPLEQVSLVYGGAMARLGDLAPGATVPVDMPTSTAARGISLATRMFKGATADTDDGKRALLTRLAIIRAISGGWGWNADMVTDPLGTKGPVVLAWTSGGILGATVGESSRTTGETLYVTPVRVGAQGEVTFSDSTLLSSGAQMDAAEGWIDEVGTINLGQGTMTARYRPAGLDGSLAVSELALRLDAGHRPMTGQASTASFLTEDEQPDQADPVRTGPQPSPGTDVASGVPRVQLLELATGRWLELEPLRRGSTYRVPDPERFVDPSGAFSVRLVNRERATVDTFVFDARLTGTAS